MKNKLTVKNYREITANASDYRVIGDSALIILGDSAELLKNTTCHFDSGIMDPPYDFKAQGGKNRFGNKTNSFEVMRRKGLDKGFDSNIIREIAKTADNMLVFHHNDQDYEITGLLTRPWEDNGAHESEPPLYDRFVKCQWRKTNPMPVANKHYVPETEPWIHAWRHGKTYPGGTLEEKLRVFDAPVGKSQYGHPTVKPLPLMRKLITNGSAPGAVVIDPFAGSGSTGVAALQLGRVFIGIERDPEYYAIAVQRLKEASGAIEAGDTFDNQIILI